MNSSVDPKFAIKVGVWLIGLAFFVVLFIAFITGIRKVQIDSALAVSGGLIVIIIALGGLTAIIGALGLSNHSEAFALPGGTVRSVLALGILTVLIFFALNQFNSTFAPTLSPTPLTEVTIAAEPAGTFKDRVDAAKTNWEGAKLVAVEMGGGRYLLFHKVENKDGIEFAKQLLVMLGTLLTSIVSFYFGSRVAEGQRPADGGGAAAPSTADLPGAKSRLSELKAKRADAQKPIDELNTLLAEARTKLPTLDEAARPAAQTAVDGAAAAIGTLTDPVKNADAAVTALEAAIPADDATKPDFAAITKAANDAAGKIDDLNKAVAAIAPSREKLVSVARAEG